MRRVGVHMVSLGLILSVGCGSSSNSGTSSSGPSSSEVATSVVSGAINNSGGGALGWNLEPARRRPVLERFLEGLNPIGKAYAATWTCSGGALSPHFAGPSLDPYAFTPVSCSVTWANDKSGSSLWSGTFTLNYGTSCDSTHPWIGNQVAGCSVTRTTASGGDTRTVTGPSGNSYAITHDTNGAGTGWDTTVSPAPGDGGVVVTCGAGGCASGGGTLAIDGSHLTGTVTPSGQASTKIWDHTVSTAGAPMTFTASGTTRLFSGTVTVQHNLARYTATATFNSVGYGQAGCCYPTTGNVTTAFQSGPFQGDTETLAFSSVCGEATLTTTAGNSVPLTLQHCL
jgi:hypothetical protein